MYFVVAFAIIGCIPSMKIRRKLNDYSFKIAFRIIARALSNVVTIHNPENKPKTSGFCVANHTSPIDVAILSADCTFSLVRLYFYPTLEQWQCIKWKFSSLHGKYRHFTHFYWLFIIFLSFSVRKICHLGGFGLNTCQTGIDLSNSIENLKFWDGSDINSLIEIYHMSDFLGLECPLRVKYWQLI